MNEMDLWISLWGSTGWVNMMSAKVSSEIERFFNWQASKILVSESHDFALGNEESELVFSC
jgi:hypothetical protein